MLTKNEKRTLFKTFPHTTDPGNSRHLCFHVGYAITGHFLDSAAKQNRQLTEKDTDRFGTVDWMLR